MSDAEILAVRFEKMWSNEQTIRTAVQDSEELSAVVAAQLSKLPVDL
jgi:hypothetical protein